MAYDKVFENMLKQASILFSSDSEKGPFLLSFVVLFSLFSPPHYLTEKRTSRKNLASNLPWETVAANSFWHLFQQKTVPILRVLCSLVLCLGGMIFHKLHLSS